MTQKGKPKAQNPQNEENGEEAESNKEGKGFYACYLLTSLCPRFKGHTYIGFTVNPTRRIRQHNGEIRCGAFRTKKRRPWEMVLCLYGFPSNVSALQFEWAWQHPMESVAVRKAAAIFKTFSGVANKIKLAYTMLNLPSWNSLNITVNYFSTLYMKHHAACPSLPDHMKVQVRSMDELPCYNKMGESVLEDEDTEIGLDEEILTCGSNSQPTPEFGFHEILNVEELQMCDSHLLPVTGIGCGETLNIEEFQTCGSNSQPVTEIGFEEPLDIQKRQACGINSQPTTDSWFDEAMNKEKLQDRGTDSQRTPLPSLVNFSRRDSAARNMRPYAEERVYELDSPQRSEFTGKMAFVDSISKTHCWWSETTCKIASDKYPLLNDSPAVSHPVEVIDLLSPSPDCRISFNKKKRRVSVDCPVIDLT